MSKLHRHEEVRIFSTPSKLRAIADRMERIQREGRPGSDLTAYVWGSESMSVVLVLDQEALGEEGKRCGFEDS